MRCALAVLTIDKDGNILHDQARTFQRSVFACHLKTTQESFFHHARERAKLEMHGTHWNAPTAVRFFLREFDDAHCDGEFMHVPTVYSRASLASDESSKGRQGCLPQADAAIVGRNGMIRPNLYTRALKERLQVFQE